MDRFHEQQLVTIAKEAGRRIMQRVGPQIAIEIKPDGSPVTEADKAADAYIIDALGQATPSIPVLSEEMPLEVQQAVMKQPLYWCVDPLDGTQLAIDYSKGDKTRDGFAVFIGLVKDGAPVFGVVHYPVQGELQNGTHSGLTYYTNAAGNAAFRQVGEGRPERLRAQPYRQGALQLVTGQRDGAIGQVAGVATEAPDGVKGNRLLRVAEGAAHAGFMSNKVASPPGLWDIAAPHAILKAAGGEVVTVPDNGAIHGKDALQQSEIVRYDGRHAAQGHEGKPYLPGGLAAHRDTLKTLGAAPLEASRTR